MNSIQAAITGQARRNRKLLNDTKYLGERITSKVLPLQIDVAHATDLSQDQIDALDKQWRAEREMDDQPLITSVLANPLSSYLTRIQARSLGVLSEIFVMDQNGLNAGQSSITSDYWQGDEAKFQKTYGAGAGAVFLDEPELNEDTKSWRSQLNFTVHDADGAPIGHATVEVNLTELARRHRFMGN